MHGGPVDHERAAAELARELGSFRAPVVEERASASVSKPRSAPRPGPPRGSSRSERGPVAILGRARRTRGRAEGVRGGVEHDRRDVEQHVLRARSPRSATATPESPTCTSSDVAPFSRSVRAASCGRFGVRVGEQRADVPAVAAGRWPDRVGQVRHERGRAQRGHGDAVEGAAGELRPRPRRRGRRRSAAGPCAAPRRPPAPTPRRRAPAPRRARGGRRWSCAKDRDAASGRDQRL